MATPVVFDYDASGGKYLFGLSGSATNPASRSRHQERGYVFLIGRAG
jgi:hypothetical protein